MNINENTNPINNKVLEDLRNSFTASSIKTILDNNPNLSSETIVSILLPNIETNFISSKTSLELAPYLKKRLNSHDLYFIVCASSFEIIPKLIDIYQDKLNSTELYSCIASTRGKDPLNLLLKYQERLSSEYLYELLTLTTISDIENVLPSLKNKLSSDHIANLINIVSPDTRKDLIIKCQNNLTSETLTKCICHTSPEVIVSLVELFAPKLESNDLALCLSKTGAQAPQLIKKYQSRLDLNNLFKALNMSCFETPAFFYSLSLKEWDTNNLNYNRQEIYNVCKYLLATNEEILQSLDPIFLTEPYLSLFREQDQDQNIYPSLRIIGKYPDLQAQIITIMSNPQTKPLFEKLYKNIVTKDFDYTSLLEKVITSLDKYKDLFPINFSKELDKISLDDQDKLISSLIFSLSKTSLSFPNLNTLLYPEDYIDKEYSHLIIKGQAQAKEQAQNIIFLKKYGLTRKEVLKIVDFYAQDLNTTGLNLTPTDQKLISFLNNLKNSLKLNLEDSILKSLTEDTMHSDNFDYYYSYTIEPMLKKMYARILNNQLLTINSSLETVPNFPGSSTKVYTLKAGQEFYVLLTNLGAYNDYDTIPTNYKDDWNKPLYTSHAFCASLVSNQMLGTAPLKHACLGFSHIPESSLLLQAPFDIGSSDAITKLYPESVVDHKMIEYLFPREMINRTRHTHNELCIERLENDRKLQPDYIIYMTESYQEELLQKWATYSKSELATLSKSEQLEYKRWKEATKAASDFELPILIIDRKKIRENEYHYLQNLLKDFTHDPQPEKMLEILTRFENNRSGYRNYWNSTGFEDQDIAKIIENIHLTIANLPYVSTKKEYYHYLLNWLRNETNENNLRKGGHNGKLELGFDTFHEKEYLMAMLSNLDTTVTFSYQDIMTLLDEVKINDLNDLMALLDLNQFTRESHLVSQTHEYPNQLTIERLIPRVAKLNNDYFASSFNDPLLSEAYSNFPNPAHDKRHLTNVSLFAALIMEDKLKSSEDKSLIPLVIEAAKYHDCGRKSDYPQEHAEPGALKFASLFKDKYSLPDLALIFTAIICHEYNFVSKTIPERQAELKEYSQAVFEYALLNLYATGSPNNFNHSYTEKDFPDICKKYHQDSEQLLEKNYLLVTTLRDADALDRTRFTRNSGSALNPDFLSEEAKSYIDFSYQLAELQACQDLHDLVSSNKLTIQTIDNISQDLNSSCFTPKDICSYIYGNPQLLSSGSSRK